MWDGQGYFIFEKTHALDIFISNLQRSQTFDNIISGIGMRIYLFHLLLYITVPTATIHPYLTISKQSIYIMRWDTRIITSNLESFVALIVFVTIAFHDDVSLLMFIWIIQLRRKFQIISLFACVCVLLKCVCVCVCVEN